MSSSKHEFQRSPQYMCIVHVHSAVAVEWEAKVTKLSLRERDRILELRTRLCSADIARTRLSYIPKRHEVVIDYNGSIYAL